MMDRETLRHGHGRPSELGPPPDCCASEFRALLRRIDQEHGRQLDEAVHAERRRVVLSALDVVRTFGENVAVALEGREKELAQKLTDHAAEAIRKTGCICPRINTTSLGESYSWMPGYDSCCGMHDGGAVGS